MLMSENEIISPNTVDAKLAQETSRSLATYLSKSNGSHLKIQNSETGEALRLPAPAVRALLHILTEMGQGHAVTVMPIHTELSTQQAADILNVSHPYILDLVDQGTLPCRKAGFQRRLLLNDVIAYKNDLYSKQVKGMEELAAISQEMGLYDDAAK